MATAEALLTAEEYSRLPDDGLPTELIRGRIVPMNVPYPRHGQICARVVYLLHRYLESDDRGHVVSNDSGVVTERDPDTVRGADVAFYSYARVPKGPCPKGYLAVAPEVAFEVLSPFDRLPPVLTKVAEYLNAGVLAVCVLDEQTQTLTVYRNDTLPQVLTRDQEFALPDLLGGFRVPVGRFFE
ncbi:MAG TPA: Uma2 family endonuclease [Gemmataceae bacterium]|jgi:Uma2 family endonuclease|nr:Uma2 family endonuclease [Gemmataceae bacterium]